MSADTKLTVGSEVLFRQIHPKFFEKGEPASNRFMPSASDENKLSLDRGSMVTAAESHANYTAGGLESAAVYGVDVSEFAGESIACHSDPVVPTSGVAANPAHAIADYSSHVAKAHKIIAVRLKRLAMTRGRLHP